MILYVSLMLISYFQIIILKNLLIFSQEIRMDGAIIVSTPQEVALLDVKRGIKMFDKLGVKILESINPS